MKQLNPARPLTTVAGLLQWGAACNSLCAMSVSKSL